MVALTIAGGNPTRFVGPINNSSTLQTAGIPQLTVGGGSPAGFTGPTLAPGPGTGTSFVNVPPPDPNAQAFGLSGAEDIIGRGALTGLDILRQTFDIAGTRFNAGQEALTGAGTTASNRIGLTIDQAGNVIDQGAEALQTGATAGLGAIQGTQGQIPGIFERGAASTEALSPFIGPGQQAGDVQAALSGALGPEAQAQAFQNFQASPGQQFLQQEGERALVRNQAAIGGLGGGNVRRELVNFGQGLALQDLGRQTGQLSDVAGRGVGAAGTQAGLLSQLSGQEAGITSQLGQFAANIPLQQAQAEAQLRSQQAGLTAGLGQFGAGIPVALGQSAANLRTQQAGLESGLGQFASTIPFAAGRDIGQLRTRAGEQLSQNIGGTTTALANFASQQGAGISDITGTGATNISNLIQAATQGDVNARLQLGAILANLSSQSGSQVSGLPIIPGATTNTLGQLGQLAGGVGGLIEGLNA
jgi:hypothetical protein